MRLAWHKILTKCALPVLSSDFGDSCFSLDFETSYVALFNGLMISGIRILVLHVYCILPSSAFV